MIHLCAQPIIGWNTADVLTIGSMLMHFCTDLAKSVIVILPWLIAASSCCNGLFLCILFLLFGLLGAGEVHFFWLSPDLTNWQKPKQKDQPALVLDCLSHQPWSLLVDKYVHSCW